MPVIIRFVAYGVAVVMALSGLGKLAAIDEFLVSLQDWTLLPPVARAPLAFCLPLAEVGFAGAYLLGIQRRVVSWCLFMLLSLLLAGAMVHFWKAPPPKCNCFGVIDKYVALLADSRLLLWKSGILISLQAMVVVFEEKVRARQGPSRSSNFSPASPS